MKRDFLHQFCKDIKIIKQKFFLKNIEFKDFKSMFINFMNEYKDFNKINKIDNEIIKSYTFQRISGIMWNEFKEIKIFITSPKKNYVNLYISYKNNIWVKKILNNKIKTRIRFIIDSIINLSKFSRKLMVVLKDGGKFLIINKLNENIAIKYLQKDDNSKSLVYVSESIINKKLLPISFEFNKLASFLIDPRNADIDLELNEFLIKCSNKIQ